MPNILQNSAFNAWELYQRWQTDQYHVLTWEKPFHWDIQCDKSLDEHVTRLPQFLHDDMQGFKIAAGYIRWDAGLRQRVMVKTGQRYILKASISPHVNQTGEDHSANKPFKYDVVEWRLEVNGANEQFGHWSSLNPSGSDKGQPRDVLLVIQAEYDGYIDVAFRAKSQWGGNICDLFIHYVGLEEVGQDYGDVVGIIQPFTGTPPPPVQEPPDTTLPTPPLPPVTPTPQPTPAPGSPVYTFPSEIKITHHFEIGPNLLALMLAVISKNVNGVPDGSKSA